MEARAVELAIENADMQNPQQMRLVEEIKYLQQTIKHKKELKKYSPYYNLLKQKELLEQQIQTKQNQTLS